MSRLIDADALFLPDEKSDKVYIIGGRSGKTVALAMELLKKKVADAQTIEAEPVRHGRWVDNHCTECGEMPMGTEVWESLGIEPPRFERFMDFCPCCGARMGGDSHD